MGRRYHGVSPQGDRGRSRDAARRQPHGPLLVHLPAAAQDPIVRPPRIITLSSLVHAREWSSVRVAGCARPRPPAWQVVCVGLPTKPALRRLKLRLLLPGGSIDFKDMNGEKNYSASTRYCMSKLANVLFSRSSQRGSRVSLNCCGSKKAMAEWHYV